MRLKLTQKGTFSQLFPLSGPFIRQIFSGQQLFDLWSLFLVDSLLTLRNNFIQLYHSFRGHNIHYDERFLSLIHVFVCLYTDKYVGVYVGVCFSLISTAFSPLAVGPHSLTYSPTLLAGYKGAELDRQPWMGGREEKCQRRPLWGYLLWHVHLSCCGIGDEWQAQVTTSTMLA